MHPDPEQEHTQPVETATSADHKEQAPAAQPAESAKKTDDKPAVTNDGYEVVRAKEGESAEVAVKPPPGFQVATGAPDSKDPHAGKFSLDEALKDLPGKGKLHATIRTSLGSLECQLFDDKAPNTVANFVGLARGLRKFWSAKEKAWVNKPYYDGTTFHRVIPEFMIQGGDWKGDGSGDMYYTIPDELHPSLKHDRGGLLCMANRGPNTNEAQFFITEAGASHLDTSYTIFGECSPVDLVKRIARVPQSGPPNNRPLTPVVIEKVTIARRPVGLDAASKVAPTPPVPKGNAVQIPAPHPAAPGGQ
jgi:peptidyl-prolyl cis-trans isomerase A (cyclophilin A)